MKEHNRSSTQLRKEHVGYQRQETPQLSLTPDAQIPTQKINDTNCKDYLPPSESSSLIVISAEKCNLTEQKEGLENTNYKYVQGPKEGYKMP